VKYWETIADNLSKAGWSLGWVSAVDSNGRTIWIADAHRGDGQRFVVRADVVAGFTNPLPTITTPFTRRRRPGKRSWACSW
jgi:hypothetical protein